MRIVIKNGRLIDPKNALDAQQDVYIAAGHVVAIGQAPDGFVAERSIDAQGLVVCPGLVDLSARLREPGYEYKATLESELRAAVAGGVTSLACPPDTDPVLDEPGLVEMLKHRARQLHLAHVYPVGALTQGLRGEQITEMAQLAEAGCVAFSQADQPIVNTQTLQRALHYARTFNYPVWLRPQDPWLGRHGVAHAGPVAGRMGLSGVPVAAETVALHTIFELLRSVHTRRKANDLHVHLCRISSAAGLELVRAAKAEGLPVSCDVGIHHVHLTDVDMGYFNSQYRLNPPLRAQEDRAAIVRALQDGTIDAVCSDHTPVDDDAKQQSFAEAEAGATGLEVLLPLTLRWAEQQKLSLLQALEKITARPAQILGIDAGHLSVGAVADICLFNPHALWRVSADALVSQGRNSPFLGYELSGRVRHTLISGHLVYSGNPT
ncbi:MAG: dihydroorotase [Burkholderiaceae bacterium]|nr:MAG: dihydroorotase [Burkholderiaceae bacterium]